MGALGNTEHRNPQKKIRRIAQYGKQKLPTTAILQYRFDTRCHTETTTLLVKLGANIAVTNFLTNIKLSNFRFRHHNKKKLTLMATQRLVVFCYYETELRFIGNVKSETGKGSENVQGRGGLFLLQSKMLKYTVRQKSQ